MPKSHPGFKAVIGYHEPNSRFVHCLLAERSESASILSARSLYRRGSPTASTNRTIVSSDLMSTRLAEAPRSTRSAEEISGHGNRYRLFQGGQPFPERIQGCLGTAGKVELAEDVAHMGANRRLADHHLIGDLPVAAALGPPGAAPQSPDPSEGPGQAAARWSATAPAAACGRWPGEGRVAPCAPDGWPPPTLPVRSP